MLTVLDYRWSFILLTTIILPVYAVISPKPLTLEDCSGVLTQDKPFLKYNISTAAAPTNVTIRVLDGNQRHFVIEWTRSSPETEVPYYFLMVENIQPLRPDTAAPVCFAVKNDREFFHFKSQLNLNGNIVSINATLRVTVSTNLEFHTGTYTSYFVRLHYPPGYKDLVNFSTPLIMKLLPDCVLEVSFLKYPKDDNIAYMISAKKIGSEFRRNTITTTSTANLSLEDGDYSIRFVPQLPRGDPRKCLCQEGGQCKACLHLVTSITILPDNKTGCRALPKPKHKPEGKIIVPETTMPPPMENVPNYQARSYRLTVAVVVVVMVILCVMVAFGLCYIKKTRPTTYDVMVIHSSRDRKLAKLFADWLKHCHKKHWRILTSIVPGQSRLYDLINLNEPDLCHYLEHVSWVCILDSRDLCHNLQNSSICRDRGEGQVPAVFVQKLKDKFMKSKSLEPVFEGRNTTDTKLKGFIAVTVNYDCLTREYFPGIVPYQLVGDCEVLSRLMGSDVICDGSRVNKMADMIAEMEVHDDKLNPDTYNFYMDTNKMITRPLIDPLPETRLITCEMNIVADEEEEHVNVMNIVADEKEIGNIL